MTPIDPIDRVFDLTDVVEISLVSPLEGALNETGTVFIDPTTEGYFVFGTSPFKQSAFVCVDPAGGFERGELRPSGEALILIARGTDVTVKSTVEGIELT